MAVHCGGEKDEFIFDPVGDYDRHSGGVAVSGIKMAARFRCADEIVRGQDPALAAAVQQGEPEGVPGRENPRRLPSRPKNSTLPSRLEKTILVFMKNCSPWFGVCTSYPGPSCSLPYHDGESKTIFRTIESGANLRKYNRNSAGCGPNRTQRRYAFKAPLQDWLQTDFNVIRA